MRITADNLAHQLKREGDKPASKDQGVMSCTMDVSKLPASLQVSLIWRSTSDAENCDAFIKTPQADKSLPFRGMTCRHLHGKLDQAPRASCESMQPLSASFPTESTRRSGRRYSTDSGEVGSFWKAKV